ncbi:MAG: hypothetical protein HY608_10290 [Planctomycetes bacterium]|nr:hypothetical protein [Planctomycetota bacterium]
MKGWRMRVILMVAVAVSVGLPAAYGQEPAPEGDSGLAGLWHVTYRDVAGVHRGFIDLHWSRAGYYWGAYIICDGTPCTWENRRYVDSMSEIAPVPDGLDWRESDGGAILKFHLRRDGEERLVGTWTYARQMEDVRRANDALPEGERIDPDMLTDASDLLTQLESSLNLADDVEQFMQEETRGRIGRLLSVTRGALQAAHARGEQSFERKLSDLNASVTEFASLAVPAAGLLTAPLLHDLQRWQGQGADTVVSGLDILRRRVEGEEVGASDFAALDGMVDRFRQGPFERGAR